MLLTVALGLLSAQVYGHELPDYGIPDELEPIIFPPAPEPPVRYRDPAVAMMLRYRKPVDIEILPSWELS